MWSANFWAPPKVDWTTSDRHYPGEPVFPDLAMIGRIETEVERNGKIELQIPTKAATYSNLIAATIPI